jgi:O-antigen/teichoic acid export membrane protein
MRVPKFWQAGAIYALANVASAAVPFMLLPLLTRLLPPAEYGRVVNFSLLVTLSLAVAGLNAHAALGVVWFKRPRDEVRAFTGTALGLAAASTLIVAPVMAFALWLFPRLGAGLGPRWAAVAVMTAGATVMLQCRLVLWQSQQRPWLNAGMQVFASLLNVGLSLVAVLHFGLGADGRNAGIAVAAILMAVLAVAVFVAAGEVSWAPNGRQLRTLIAFGAPLIPHTLAGVLLSTADRWLVATQLGPMALGIYGAGAQLGMVMAVLADAFVKAYAPWLYARLAASTPTDRYCAVGAIFAAIPMFLGAAAIIGVLVFWASGVVLGERYAASVAVLPWFMLGGAFTGMYVCTSVLFFFSGRTGLLASVTMSAAVLGAASTWALVRSFGVEGAAMGYAGTQGLLAILTFSTAVRSFDLPWFEPVKALRVWASVLRGGGPTEPAVGA